MRTFSHYYVCIISSAEYVASLAELALKDYLHMLEDEKPHIPVILHYKVHFVSWYTERWYVRIVSLYLWYMCSTCGRPLGRGQSVPIDTENLLASFPGPPPPRPAVCCLQFYTLQVTESWEGPGNKAGRRLGTRLEMHSFSLL